MGSIAGDKIINSCNLGNISMLPKSQGDVISEGTYCVGGLAGEIEAYWTCFYYRTHRVGGVILNSFNHGDLDIRIKANSDAYVYSGGIVGGNVTGYILNNYTAGRIVFIDQNGLSRDGEGWTDSGDSIWSDATENSFVINEYDKGEVLRKTKQ